MLIITKKTRQYKWWIIMQQSNTKHWKTTLPGFDTVFVSSDGLE